MRIGERVPQATLFGPRTLLDKALGRSPTFELAADSHWRYAGDAAAKNTQPSNQITNGAGAGLRDRGPSVDSTDGVSNSIPLTREI